MYWWAWLRTGWRRIADYRTAVAAGVGTGLDCRRSKTSALVGWVGSGAGNRKARMSGCFDGTEVKCLYCRHRACILPRAVVEYCTSQASAAHGLRRSHPPARHSLVAHIDLDMHHVPVQDGCDG